MIFLPTVTAVYYQTTIKRTSLVVQGLKIHLPVQGHRVWSLVGELRTGGTKSALATTELVHREAHKLQ